MRRVVVTGLGVVTPLGNTPALMFDRLLAGSSGIRRLETDFVDRLSTRIAAPVTDFDPLEHFSRSKARSLDRVTQFALVAAQQSVADAGLDMTNETRERIGVYLGTGMGGATASEEGYVRLHRDNESRLKPYTVLMAMNNAAGSQIALDHDLTGPSLTFSTACSSSAIAIGEAYRLIQHGYADVMLAGGSEALLTYSTIKAWEALRTLADEDPVDPATSCKPFSADRSGLVLGEGAAILVVEEYARARARGAHIYGEIIGYGSSNDSAHITQPSLAGQARAMRLALEEANVGTVSYINAHGTATRLNDAVESAAIKQVLGTQVPVSSTKSMHGHLMGAAGAVEFAACMMVLERQALPPTAHLRQPDPACDLDYVPNIGRSGVKVETVMSNSFAFGGTCGVLIAGKVE